MLKSKVEINCSYLMKKLLLSIPPIPQRTAFVIHYTVGILIFFIGVFGVLLLPFEWIPAQELTEYLTFSGFFLLCALVVTFAIGRSSARKEFLGRPINVNDLTTPGTWLPQNEGTFWFLGRHDLGKDWAVATFVPTERIHLTLGPPLTTSQSKLFNVILPSEALPNEPRFVKLCYDQRRNYTLSVLPKQSPEAN